MKFDKDLGLLTSNDAIAHAVRLLVIIQAPEDDEVVATPDPTNQGFRVARKVKCALAVEALKSEFYEIKIIGLASTVQWLMTASADSCFQITANGRSEEKAFTVIAYEDATAAGATNYMELMTNHMDHIGDVAVNLSPYLTPSKRLRVLNDAVNSAPTPLFSVGKRHKRCP